jgi:hypothetical protein
VLSVDQALHVVEILEQAAAASESGQAQTLQHSFTWSLDPVNNSGE